MQCPLCGHPKTHKHGTTSKGSQRYRCPRWHQTFSETFDTLYYRRQISAQTLQTILQSHAEGTSLRGISPITGVAYNPCVIVVRSASHKAQIIHNQDVQAVSTDVINADELWSFCFKLPNGANRSPDVAWVAQERWNALSPEAREQFSPIAPDFVLELMSPSDTLAATQVKM